MLRIVETIIELIGNVAPLAEQIARRDPSLAKQLRDALSSVALNAAEASGQIGGRRTNHYAIALGSARESLTALKVAGAWGYIGPVPQPILEMFGKVIGTLVKNVKQ